MGVMRDAVAATCGISFVVLLVWWLALFVIAVKGLLFHRHERYTVRVDPEDHTVEEPSLDDPVLSRGCLWAFIIFMIWPLALAEAFDGWLSKREAKSRLPNS
jgi:hypothetical protein